MRGDKPGDTIVGDSIYIQCRTLPKRWQVFHMSGNHKGSKGTIRKNALARVERKFTSTNK